MGQQQLLLLVIGIVMVGFAVMAGMYAFRHHQMQDEADGLMERSLAIASYAVQWKMTNDPFVGGNQSYAQLAEGGIERLSLSETTIRGRFAITAADKETMEITAVSDRYPNVGVRVYVEGYNVPRSEVRSDGTITFETQD